MEQMITYTNVNSRLETMGEGVVLDVEIIIDTAQKTPKVDTIFHI